MHPAPRMTQTG